MFAYVDHHDKAYAWAGRRRIEEHPRTGAIQIVEVRERVENLPSFTPKPTTAPTPFAKLNDDDLLSVGVPSDWLADVRAASDDAFLELAPHLPAEAAEALLQFATTGALRSRPGLDALEPLFDIDAPSEKTTELLRDRASVKAVGPLALPLFSDPYSHPDTLRRIRVIDNLAELAQALDAPWEKWLVYLHPSQRDVVARNFPGPARVAGSAGTGKTVVALHRAARLARSSPDARVLLATFSEPLATSLQAKARLLLGPEPSVTPRLRVASLPAIAAELFELAFGHRAHIAKDDQVARALERAAEASGLSVNMNFLASEWQHVVDAWQVKDAAGVSRRASLRAQQAGRLQATRTSVADLRRGASGPRRARLPHLVRRLHRRDRAFRGASGKPFTHIVVDEAQDLGVPQLRFLAAVSALGPTASSSPAISANASSNSPSPGRRSASTSAAAPSR